jgi:Predicted transcriptional regulators
MTLLRLSSAALSRSRFAVSPLAETVSCLIALQLKRSEPWVTRWLGTYQAEYRTWLAENAAARGLVPLLAATKWLPDFVAIPPRAGLQTRLADELTAVSAHTDAEIIAMVGDAVAASWAPCDTGWLDLGDLGTRVSAVLEEAWSRFVKPDWPQRRTVLERDIVHRAGVLAAYGWQHAVEDMAPIVGWVGSDAILFSHQEYPDRWIDEQGLIFVPHTPGGGAWMCESPPHFALVYPARGSAAEISGGGSAAADKLLGPGRARVLRELIRPATSSQLAVTLGLSLGTVSAHLAVLRETGVVIGSRAGRNVVYRLTERGEGLLALLCDPAT